MAVPTQQRLEQVLRDAHNAGDTKNAQFAADLIRQYYPRQPMKQEDVEFDAMTGADSKEQPGFFDRAIDKAKGFGEGVANVVAGAGERIGDIAGGFLGAVGTLGEALEEKMPLGRFVWKDGNILPDYYSPGEFKAIENQTEDAFAKGSQALKNIDLGYEEQTNWQNVKDAFSEGGALSGSAYGEAVKFGLEQGVKSVGDMAAAVFALPAYIVARSGEIGEQRAINKGKEKTEAADVLEAVPVAIGSAILERIGAKGVTTDIAENIGKEALELGVKEMSKEVAKGGGKEAATEALQSGVIEYVGERYGTDKAMDFREALDQAAAGAVAGGVFGTTVSGVSAGASALQRKEQPGDVLARELEKEIDQTELPAESVGDVLSPADSSEVPPQRTQAEAIADDAIDLRTATREEVEAAPILEEADVATVKVKPESIDIDPSLLASVKTTGPMPNHQPLWLGRRLPQRPESGKIELGGRTFTIPPVQDPMRKERIRRRVEDIIGPRLYQGKVKQKGWLGFYNPNTSELRIKKHDEVEVLAHEMAHFLDKHYTQKERFTKAYKDPKVNQQVRNVSYTKEERLQETEGFAEYTRLWLTQYDKAKSAAPDFTKSFEKVLAKDKKLNGQMRKLQDMMHAWYYQGPEAQLRASSGEKFDTYEKYVGFSHKLPAERLRQEMIDRFHGAKVAERVTQGGMKEDATKSTTTLFQMINGAESMHESVIEDGTIALSSKGHYIRNGKGLKEIFAPVVGKGGLRDLRGKGAEKFNELMDFFKAMRGYELAKQGRENALTTEQIIAGLKLADKKGNSEFRKVFREYQAFNERMLQFYTQMGLITTDQYYNFKKMNQNYVPFHRVINHVLDGEGDISALGAPLLGGDMNTRDIAENIVEGLFANIRASLIARAKTQLYEDAMNSKDGALIAVRLKPDSKLVKDSVSSMSFKVAEIMKAMGMNIVKGNVEPGNPKDISIDAVAGALRLNPKLMHIFIQNQKPTTNETFVDSAIIDGKQEFFETRNPVIAEMMSSMGGFKNGAVLTALMRVKNLQTRTVTSMLQFLGPNAIRDTVSSAVISKNGFIPFWSTVKGMYKYLSNSEAFKDFRRQGGAYAGRIEARTADTRARYRLDTPSGDILSWDGAMNRIVKALAKYDRFVSVFEYGSRVEEFSLAKKRGKSSLKAAQEAREVATDFSKIGGNEMWSKFLRTVPFMGAGIQGLDKTAREVFEIEGEMKGSNLVKMNDAKARFLIAGSAITAGTLILTMMNSDNEKYEELTPDEKARFWHIFLPGGKHIRIPRPYDIGHVFATIPEAMYRSIKEKEGKEAADMISWAFINTLSVGDYPGLFQPMIDVAKNKKFTGSPIVPGNLENVSPEYQFTDATPEIYRQLGKALGISPLVAEHYAQGYFRYVEAMVSDAADAALWDKEKWGERPYSSDNLFDAALNMMTRQFNPKAVSRRTKYTEGYWELKKRAALVKGNTKVINRELIRDPEMYKGFNTDKMNQTMLSLDKMFSKIDSKFEDQRDYMASIKYNKNLTKKQKEQKIDDYYIAKNKVLADTYKAAQKLIEQSESSIKKARLKQKMSEKK